MAVTKIFLGWEKPWIDLFSDWLLQHPDQLRRRLVVVPTRESGRRLRERLIAQSSRAGIGALLGPRVATPEDFFRPETAMTDAVRWAGWLHVLHETHDDEVNELFPTGLDDKDDAWRLAVIQQIEQARETLISIHAEFSTVAKILTEDGERWQQLAALERRVCAVWKRWGFADPVRAKRDRAMTCRCPQGVDEIILAGVTDPMPLAIEAWRRLVTQNIPVTLLIGAPETFAGHFDDWGRPLAEFWSDRTQHATPAPTSSQVAADAGALARAVTRACAGKHNRDVAVGVCDPAFIPAIARCYSENGWKTFAPEGVPLSQDGWPELLEALASAVDAPSDHAAIARVARHPVVWKNFLKTDGIRSTFAALDEWETAHATSDTKTNIERLQHIGLPGASELLAKVFILVKTAGAPLELQLRNWFATEASDAAEAALAEMDSWPLVQSQGIGASQCLRWLATTLTSMTHTTDAGDALVDLQGWLELPFDPAPHLILAALHDGSVPELPAAGPLITEAVRERLHLRNRQTRLAREVFLYTAMVEGRRATGSVTVVTAQFDAQGEPCKPSRVLLHAAPENLSPRVLQFIKKQADLPPAHTPPWSRGEWKLRPLPGMAANRKWDHLSPSTLKAYLACPTRFYFQKVLGWEKFAPFANALDAAQFGDLIHAVLQKWGNDEAARDLDDAGKLRACWLELLKKLTADRFGEIASPLIRLQIMSAEERLAALAEKQAEQRQRGWRVIHTESEFNGALTLAGVPVHLRIDRIDQHTDGRVRVIDYKTGKTARDPEKTHLRVWDEETGGAPLGTLLPAGKRMYGWTDLQLPLYAGAVKERLKLDQLPEACYALLPEAVSDTDFLQFENMADKTGNAMEWAEEAARRIVAGIFWPPHPEPDYDDFAALAPEGLAAALGEEWAAFLSGDAK
jgi:ATP-dependent helicase/nuclease subunit B